jgi:hypothetical protein
MHHKIARVWADRKPQNTKSWNARDSEYKGLKY